MSNPYTIRDPYHASEYYILKRAAKCKGCTTGDFPHEVDSPLMKGEKVIKVTIGNGPSSRTQHFHPECYFQVRNSAMAEFLNSAWKVQPEKRLALVDEAEWMGSDDLSFDDTHAHLTGEIS